MIRFLEMGEMVRKFLSFLFLGFLLSGCYQSSLTYVAPATGGLIQGKASQSLASTSLSYAIKEKTGKTPLEHVFTEKQIETIETKKAKLNPCEKNLEFCSAIKTRIEKARTELLKNRIEKTRKQLKSLNSKEIAKLKK